MFPVGGSVDLAYLQLEGVPNLDTRCKAMLLFDDGIFVRVNAHQHVHPPVDTTANLL